MNIIKPYFYAGWRHLFTMFILMVFCLGGSAGTTGDEVLLTVHDRKITKGEFLYHFNQNYKDLNQENVQEYIELFIDFHLKLAMAREQRLHHQIGFINELAEYRLLLAAPYLTDQKKIDELAQEAKERLNYKWRTNHILVKFPVEASPEDTLKAYYSAVQIHRQIQQAGSFQEVATTLSQDPFISVNHGDTSYITAFQSEYAYESAVYHMAPGEISKPVKSHSGYFIIQLVNKRKSESFPDDNELYSMIEETKDERKDIIKDAFVSRLKKEWNFKENKELLNFFTEFADERIYKGTWTPPAGEKLKANLFFIDGKGVTVNDFSDYLQNIDYNGMKLPVNDFIRNHYEQFVSNRLIQYENYKLPEKYPVFRYQYEEYRDGMLLLEITKQQVWQKASSDSAGLKKFFEENRMNYPVSLQDITLKEVFEPVQDDYQEWLMNQWVKELRGLYKVEVDEKVLSSILNSSSMD